ncbi:unnamed protein product [Lampetra fluviatilis]
MGGSSKATGDRALSRSYRWCGLPDADPAGPVTVYTDLIAAFRGSTVRVPTPPLLVPPRSPSRLLARESARRGGETRAAAAATALERNQMQSETKALSPTIKLATANPGARPTIIAGDAGSEWINKFPCSAGAGPVSLTPSFGPSGPLALQLFLVQAQLAAQRTLQASVFPAAAVPGAAPALLAIINQLLFTAIGMSGHPARPTAAPFCGLFQQGPDGPRSPHVAHTGGPGFPFVGNEAATVTPQFPRDAGSRSALAGGGGGGGSAPGTWNSQHQAQSRFLPAGNSAVLPASSAAAAGGRMTTTMMMALNSSSSGRSSGQQQNPPHFSREPISQRSKLQPTPPSHNGQQQQHQGPTWARSGQRHGMSEERASNILATFGLSSEDLGHLAAYPDEELTPHNLPRILQEIQSRKRDNGFATTTIANHNDERTRRIGEGRSGSLVPYRVDVPDGDGLGHVLYAGTSSFSCKELLEVYNPEEPTSDGYEDAREWALPGSCEFAPPSETDSVKSCGSGSGSATGSGSGCASRMGRSDAVRPPAGARGPAALGWERLGRTEPTAEEAEDFLGLPAAAFPRTCAVCGVRLLCDKGWRQHITGKKHKSKCRVFALRSPPQFGLPGNGPSPSVDGPSGASPAFGGFATLPSLPPGAPPTPAQQVYRFTGNLGNESENAAHGVGTSCGKLARMPPPQEPPPLANGTRLFLSPPRPGRCAPQPPWDAAKRLPPIRRIPPPASGPRAAIRISQAALGASGRNRRRPGAFPCLAPRAPLRPTVGTIGASGVPSFDPEVEILASGDSWNDASVKDGAGRPDSAGRVVHFHNLPPVAFTEADIIRLGLPFGKVTNYILMRSKNQAFLEMARPEAARALVRTYAAQPPLLQEQPVAVQMSSSYQRLVLKVPFPPVAKPGRPVDEVLMEETGHSARARPGTAQSRVRSRSPLSRDRESPTANAARSFSPVPWKRSRSPWRRESLSSSSPGPSTPSPRRQPQSPLENPSQGRTRPTSPREHEATMDDGETMMRESETKGESETTTRENGARPSPAPSELEDLAQGAWRRDPTERRGDGAGETRGGASMGGGAGGGATEEPSRLHTLRDRDEEQDFFLGDVGFVTVDEVGAEEEMGEEEKGSVHLVVGEGSGGEEAAAADEVAAAAAASVAARLVDERAPPGGGDRPSGDEVANLPDVAPRGGDAADTEETAPAPVPAANGDGRSEGTADADAEAPAPPRVPRGTRDEPASFPRSRRSESDGDVQNAEGPRPGVVMEGDEGAGSGDDRRDGWPRVVKPAGQPLAPELQLLTGGFGLPPTEFNTNVRRFKSGVNFVVPRTGFYCLLCRLFYVCESSAREGHCRSPTHYRNVERYLIQRLRELGESGLGEAMGAECGEHVAEGHRTQL